MTKGAWKESKIVISLPDDIVAEYSDDAARLYTGLAEYLRQYLIAGKRGPQTVATAPTVTQGPRASRSGYKGVYAYGKRWEAVIYVGGKRQRIAVFDTAEAAARAYDSYLIGQANGDPNAAVNFPGPADALAATSAPFIEQFASGRKLTDIEWKQWQQQQATGAALDAPLSVRPDGPPIDASTPLIDRPAKSLYRRDSAPTLSAPPTEPDDLDEN